MAKQNKQQKQKQNVFNHRINDDLKGHYDVRIVGNDIESRVVSLDEAKRIANEMGMDLIEINNSVRPSIMRIATYDKFLYELKKSAKAKKQSTSSIKEIQLTVNIAKHDLLTKAKKAQEFIEDGNKVKVVLTMKGRELTRREENKRSIFEFIDTLSEVAVPESMPKDENNRTIVMLKKKK